MSETMERIAREQCGQTVLFVDDAFLTANAGPLNISEYVRAVTGTVADAAQYVLNLAPPSVAEGQVCSILISVGEDATVTVTYDGQTLFNVNDGSIFAVLFCDGRYWHVIWDRNAQITLAARNAVPDGGTTGQMLVKASGDDGDTEWATPVVEIPVGGTTGQVLAKKSGTDFDLEWITP